MRLRSPAGFLSTVLFFSFCCTEAAGAALRLNFYEGEISIGGHTLVQNTQQPLDTGDVIETPAGRAELFVQPDVYLRIGQQSSVRVVTGAAEATEVELVSGSLVLDSKRAGRFLPVSIRVRDSVTRIGIPGEYRFDASPARMQVFRGSAEVSRGGAGPLVQGPGVVTLSDQAPGGAGGDDLLDIWSTNRRIHLSTSFVSGPTTEAAPEPPPPAADDDNVTSPASSLGFLFLTGIPELMYIPQQPYRVGSGYFGPMLLPGYVPYAGAYAGAYPGPFGGVAGPRPAAPAFNPSRGLAFPAPPSAHIGHPVIGH